MSTVNIDHPVVLSLIPLHLHNIEDWLALGSTSRCIRTHLHSATSPHHLLLLSYSSRRIFYRPDPTFLLVHLASAISSWASLSPHNLGRMVESFWSGEEALLELAVSIPYIAHKAGWNTAKLTYLWEWRMRVMNPLADLLDKCIGKQWQERDEFWEQEDAVTMEADPPGVLLRLIMYGEMFGEAWREWIRTAPREVKRGKGEKGVLQTEEETIKPIPPHLSLATRLEFLKYILPDWQAVLHPFMTPLPSITSQRDVRADEVVYHSSSVYIRLHPLLSSEGITQDGDTTLPPSNTTPDPPLPLRTCHPLRAIQHDLGPYSPPLVPGQNVFAPRLTDEHMSSTRHLLLASLQWKSFLNYTTGIMEIMYSGWFPPRDTFDQGTWRQAHYSAGMWMYGLRGAERMAEIWSRSKGDLESSWRLNDEEVGYWGTRKDDEVLMEWGKLRRELRDIRDPKEVVIGRRHCYEEPSLLHEVQVLLSQ